MRHILLVAALAVPGFFLGVGHAVAQERSGWRTATVEVPPSCRPTITCPRPPVRRVVRRAPPVVAVAAPAPCRGREVNGVVYRGDSFGFAGAVDDVGGGVSDGSSNAIQWGGTSYLHCH